MEHLVTLGRVDLLGSAHLPRSRGHAAYRGVVTRSPLFLAALASSAVPGLDPVAVEGVRTRPEDPFEVAHVRDSHDRLWSVKSPRTQAAAAALEDVSTLSQLLGRRLEVAIPMVRGQVSMDQGRAVVYPRVPGRPLNFTSLPAGGLAAEVGRTLGHIHNVEHLLFEEAGLVSYDAEAHRRRQLSELDRAAATGHVPTNLLTRWEHQLEEVSLWRFAPCPVHGSFVGENVLASFDDDTDAASGRVRGVLAWEEAHIGDPADDFAELISLASPDAVDCVLEAYAQSRVERPDNNLVSRARLAGEMALVRTLLRALSAGQLGVVERVSESLRDLDAQTEAEDRRHDQEDAARLERDRLDRAEAFAAAETAAGRLRPAQLPDDAAWEATAPHAPFSYDDGDESNPDDRDEADDPEAGDRRDDAEGPDPQSSGAEEPDGTTETADLGGAEHGGVTAHRDDGEHPEAAHDDSTGTDQAAMTSSIALDPESGVDTGSVPVLDRDDAAAFEIEQAEPLPADNETIVLDEHEGASAFVPVDPSDQRTHPASG